MITKYTKSEFRSLPRTYRVLVSCGSGLDFEYRERKVRWYHRFIGLPAAAEEKLRGVA